MNTALPLSLGLAVLGLGLQPLLKKAALEAGVSPYLLAFVVLAMAALMLWVYGLARSSFRYRDELQPSTLLHVFFIGALGSGAVSLLAIVAMTETTATSRSLFQAMYPVATAVCARLILGERLSVLAYGIIAVMSGGLYLMNAGDSGLRGGRAFWMLAATLPLIGLADVYAKRVLADTPADFVATGRLVFGALALAPVVWWSSREDWSALIQQLGWVSAASVAMAAGMIGLYRSLDLQKASITAACISLAPVMTVVGEWWYMGSRFDAGQLVGIALVVGGSAWLAFTQSDS